MPKRKKEKVKQVKAASRAHIGKLPRPQIIRNKKKDSKEEIDPR